jgi:hypothetical protein
MAAARGDSKPCMHAECAGTMHFSREPLRQVATTLSGDGERGWVCSEKPSHFQLASEGARREATASSAPRARWEDDGGSTPGKHTTSARPSTAPC